MNSELEEKLMTGASGVSYLDSPPVSRYHGDPNVSVEVAFGISAEDLEKFETHPETAFANVVKRTSSKTEIKVSRLTTAQRQELERAKDAELNTWLQHAVVTAAGRKGIPMGALMKMRWVVTMKPDKTLKARLVV